MLKVAKFGGTSLADAAQIKKAANIIRKDSQRRFIVVSAPGKRFPEDEKITDLLLRVHEEIRPNPNEALRLLIKIRQRFIDISVNLDLKIESSILDKFGIILEHIHLLSKEFLVSRGEYFSAYIMAAYLGFEFVDAKDLIGFDENGNFDQELTNANARALRLQGKSAVVIPGFYGAMTNGEIKTFSRGGSDITGAIIANLVNAHTYENWTDVDGIRMADPRVVHNPKKISFITYKELRELTYMGANVLHDEAVFPLRKAKILIHIRNTNDPEALGTLIVPDDQAPSMPPGSIVGVAARKGFTVITVDKAMMNREVGFVQRLSSVIEQSKVSIDFVPSGIDNISIIIGNDQLKPEMKDALDSQIHMVCDPDALTFESGMAMICIVGRAMAKTPGVSAKIFSVIAKEQINVRTIIQGSRELSVIVGVDDEHCDRAVNAIYRAFASQE